MTNPSIWTPGQAVSAESSNRVQTFIASAGQTDFIITNFTYETGTNSLEVSVSGVTQRPGIDYIETGSNSFSLTSPVEDVGTAVFVRGLVEVSGNPQVVSDASNVSYLTETVKTALDVRLPEIANYAVLRAYAGLVTAYYVRGVTDIFDGGAGVFRVDAADATTADNGGTVLVDASGRRWKREFSGDINVKWFGAVGDGVTDDTAAIQAAVDSGAKTIFFPPSDYIVSSTVIIQTNGTALIGSGHGSSRLIASADGVSVLEFSSVSPTTTTLQNCSISDIGVRVRGSVSSITSGVGVTLINCQQFKSNNLQIEGFFGGLLIIGGGINFFDNLSINSGYNFGAPVAGSYGLKSATLALGGGNYKTPAGTMVNNFDIWNGGGSGYLAHAIVMEACDGFWFSNGHCGFTGSDCLLVQPAVTGSSNVWVIGLSFNQVHFDGFGGVSDYCVRYSVPVGFSGSIRRHSYTGCHAGNAAVNCYDIAGGAITDISISGGRVNLWNEAEWGIRVKDSNNISIVGVVIDALGSTGITGGGIQLDGADFVKVDAILNALPIGVALTNNATRNNIEAIFKNCADDVNTAGLTNFTNRVSGSTTNKSYEVASSAELTLPYPFEYFYVTGTTTINSINAADAFLHRKVTLIFNVACTVTDGTILLAGAFTSTPNSTLTLLYGGNAWVEVSRSVV